MSRIVTLGAATQDIYLLDRDDFAGVELSEEISIFGKMQVGDKIDIDHVHFDVGGGGTNAATTFARYGHETIFMGSIGRDSSGEAVLQCLDQENIDSSYVNFVPTHTDCSVVLLDVHNADRTILAYRGASKNTATLDPSDLDAIQPDWLYTTGLRGDMHKLLAFFEKAHALGTKVMFNPGPEEYSDTAKLIGLLELTDVLLVNKAEAARLVPGTILAELVARLHNYCPVVLITDGIMGAIATDGQSTYRFGVYEQERMRDRTGAGDAFGSGFLAKYAAGAKFKDALLYAAANASKVTQHYGAKQGIMVGTEALHPMTIQKVKE